MNIKILASAALVSFAALTGAASAQTAAQAVPGVVPGSDYYRDASASARTNSVIRGDATGPVNRVSSRPSIVPGSDYFVEAQADANANSVIRGTAQGRALGMNETRAFGYPNAGVVANPSVVPGSDYYTEGNADMQANSVIRR